MNFFLACSDQSVVGNYFNGIAFSRDSCIVSTDGLIDYVSEGGDLDELIDGRFSLCITSDEITCFRTDSTGQDCWFFYAKEEFWVVSNSFYALLVKLKEKNIILKIKNPCFSFFSIIHSIGDQPFSENTLVDGVNILPRDSFIEIKNKNFYIKKNKDVNKISCQEDYVNGIEEYVSLWRSRLISIFTLFSSGQLRCDLSGGVDSRIVMALTKFKNEKKIKYSSNKSWKDDFVVASLLAEMFKLEINNSDISLSRTLSVDNALNIYKFGNAGIYKNVYWPKHLTPPNSLHMHGAGGENIRGLGSGSAWSVAHRVSHYFSHRESYEEFKFEYLNWFERNNIDCKSNNSTILHYRNFRGRFHFGRNWFRSLTNPLLTPLSSKTLEGMADYLVETGQDPKTLQFDILYLCDSILPFFPFDKMEKNFSMNIVKNSFKYTLNKNFRTELRTIKIYGSIPTLSENFATNVSDIDISMSAINSVDEFLKNSSSCYVSELKNLLEADGGKLKSYGLIEVLKLIDY